MLAMFFFAIITSTSRLNSRGRFYRQRYAGQTAVTGIFFLLAPPVLASISIVHKARRAFPLLVNFHQNMLTHALVLSATREKGTEKYLIVIMMYVADY